MVLFGEVLGGAEAVEPAWPGAASTTTRSSNVHASSRGSRRGGAAGARARAKATIAAMADVADHDEAVHVELAAQLWSLQQPEFAERLAAMRERDQPAARGQLGQLRRSAGSRL